MRWSKSYFWASIGEDMKIARAKTIIFSIIDHSHFTLTTLLVDEEKYNFTITLETIITIESLDALLQELLLLCLDKYY